MTTYTVQGPSGKSYTIDGPEGATADQLGQVILSQSHDERSAAEYQREKAQYNPTNDMSTGERVLAGIGRGMTSVARGLGGLVGLQSDADTADAKATDAPLMATTAGKVGSAIGNAAAVAPAIVTAPASVAGMGALGTAAAVGGGVGALTTEGGLQDRAEGALGGAVGGAVGTGIGKAIGAGAGAVKNVIANKLAAQAPQRAAVQAAQDAGYVLPPNQVQPSALNALTQAWSGPVKTTQVAAAKNQATTNALAARAVGLPEGQPITADALDAVRKNAGGAYDAVASTGTIAPTPAYNAALDKIIAPYQQSAKGFPNAKPNPIIDTIESLRSDSFDAASAIAKTKELRADASAAFAKGDKAQGNALKAASNAIEDQVDQHLVANNAPADTLQNFRDARQLIAKTYDVQKAIKGDNISAQTLANTQSKTGRLTNELATIADTANQFPKATQLLKEAPSPYSAVDGFGGLSSVGSAAALHNPLAALPLAAIAARPALRAFILSPTGQALARQQIGPTAATALMNGLQSRVLTSELTGATTSAGANRLSR